MAPEEFGGLVPRQQPSAPEEVVVEPPEESAEGVSRVHQRGEHPLVESVLFQACASASEPEWSLWRSIIGKNDAKLLRDLWLSDRLANLSFLLHRAPS